jgi:hypothetical protein
MNCSEARELIGADPDALSGQLRAHLEACPECHAHRAQMLALNAKIRRALNIDPQVFGRTGRHNTPVLSLNQGSGQPAIRRHSRPRGMAIGVSLAAGLLVAFTLWLSRPTQSLASEIVAHVEGEPTSWASTEPVSAAELAAVLHKSNVRMGPGLGPIVYASSCWFRGRFVPHLVVSTPSGNVTVMILKNERIKSAQPFNDDGFAGLLVPARSGGIAILSRTPMALGQPANEVLRALQAAND